MQKALLLRPKVWISYHQTLDIENLNCHNYLTVWIFKKTWILLELSQLLTGHFFQCKSHINTGFGWFPAAERSEVSVDIRSEWVRLRSLWRYWSPRLCKGAAAGNTRLRSGRTPLTRALLLLFFKFFIMILTLGRAEAFFPTWNCCCRGWKQSCTQSCCGQLGGCAWQPGVFLALWCLGWLRNKVLFLLSHIHPWG